MQSDYLKQNESIQSAGVYALRVKWKLNYLQLQSAAEKFSKQLNKAKAAGIKELEV